MGCAARCAMYRWLAPVSQAAYDLPLLLKHAALSVLRLCLVNEWLAGLAGVMAATH